jgi:hypothetical protein
MAEALSKTEAVRRAIAEGWNKPSEGAMFVKTMFGIELSPNHFSNIKSTLRAAPAPALPTPGKKRGRPPGRKPMLAATVVELREEPASGTIDLEAIQSVKELVGKLGAETLTRLVDTLGA